MKKILSFLISLTISLTGYSQFIVKGKVTDITNNEPLIGATIKVLDSDYGTTSDIDGNFILTIDYTSQFADSSLKVSFEYIGYYSEYLNLKKDDSVTVQLQLDLSLDIFKEHKLKNSLELGYYGDYSYAPIGFEANYYFEGINSAIIDLNFNYKNWTDLSENSGYELSFNYDIPNGHNYIPDNFHISHKNVSYRRSDFTMHRTRVKLSNVWRGFGIDYGISYYDNTHLTKSFYAISAGGYFNMHRLIYQTYSFDLFARGDYGMEKLYYEVGVIKGFRIKDIYFFISATYYDYDNITGFNLGLRFNIFNTRIMRCCYYWQPNYN